MLTHSRLLECLDYDSSTGLFTWKWRTDIDERVNHRDAYEIAGRTGGDSYVTIGIDYQQYSAHRLAVFYMTGKWPTQVVDHIDGNKSNNAWSNLRVVTPQQNTFNSGVSKNNTSGHKGVCWDKKNQKWLVSIMINRKSKFLGRYTDLQEAIKVRKDAEQNLFGQFRRI